MSPPIRPAHQGHHDALWRGLATGMLDVGRHRSLPVHDGAEEDGSRQLHADPERRAGIEDRLQLLYTYGVCERHFDVQRMVALGAPTRRSIFGLYPRKGTIAIGSDADLVVYDPCEHGHAQRQDPPLARATAASSRAAKVRGARPTSW